MDEADQSFAVIIRRVPEQVDGHDLLRHLCGEGVVLVHLAEHLVVRFGDVGVLHPLGCQDVVRGQLVQQPLRISVEFVAVVAAEPSALHRIDPAGHQAVHDPVHLQRIFGSDDRPIAVVLPAAVQEIVHECAEEPLVECLVLHQPGGMGQLLLDPEESAGILRRFHHH